MDSPQTLWSKALCTSLSLQHGREQYSPLMYALEMQLSHSYHRQLAGKGDMEGQDAINLMNTFSDRKVLRPEVFIMIIYSELL